MGLDLALGVCKAMVSTIGSWCRRVSHGLTDPDFRVDYQRSDLNRETVTLRVLDDPITKVIIEQDRDIRLVIDPAEIPSLLPGQPRTCSLYVEQGTPGSAAAVTTLVGFLGTRSGAKLMVYFRFTDSKGRRCRIPFLAEKVGSRHEIHWTPGRMEKASPEQ